MPTIELNDDQIKGLQAILGNVSTKVKPVTTEKKVEEKKIDLDKPKPQYAKLISPFSEIFCYIFDVESCVYDLIQVTPNKDNYIVCDGVTYEIDRKMIMGKMKGYDPKMDMLSGFKKLKRWISRKDIGVLMFQRPSPDQIDDFLKKDKEGNPELVVSPFYREIVEPITKVKKTIRDDKKTYEVEMELVACKPVLLKTIAITPLFQNMIRSFKSLEGHGKMGKWWKWILIAGVAIAIIFVIIYFINSGTVNVGGV